MKYIFEKFDSLTSYLNAIGSRPMNSIFSNAQTEHSKTGSSEFTGTKNYDESVQIAMKGYAEGLDQLNKAGSKRLNVSAHAPKSMPCSGPIGHAPIVANAILGLPNSMVYTKQVVRKTKVVSVWYDPTASCSYNISDFAKAGRNVLELVMMLEQNGYRVELNIVTAIAGSSEILGNVVKVKTDKQPMNPLKISYPMLHASYLRRNFFKWLETCKELGDKSVTHAYGTPIYHKLGQSTAISAKLRAEKILPDNAFFTNFYDALDNNAEKLMKLMKLN